MKTFKKKAYFLLALCAMIACSDTELENFELQQNKPVRISAGNVSGTIVKTNESIIVPVGLTLSDAASKAFEISLAVNQDTILKLIDQGTLTDVAAISASAIIIDNVAKVSFGSDATTFNITVARTEVEKHFGKKLAIAYTLENAGKDNLIDISNNTGIITIDTRELLTPEDIHYISFRTGGGGIIEAKNRQNYQSSSGGMTIPLTVGLASFPGNPFSVNIVTNRDTIAEMVDNGILPANTIALQEGQYTISEKVNFGSNSSEATFEIDIPWFVINDNMDKKLALMVRLENPTLHVLDTTKSYTTILIDSENVIEVDVTALGAFSVNRDNSGGPDAGEGSKKLVDGNFSSKFLMSNFVGDLECTMVFPEPQKIGAYTMTSANDANSRDPNEWHLEASNDGINWTRIDSRSGEVFAARLMTRRFDIEFPAAYTHYRLHITSIVGGTNLFQLSEWRLIRIP